MSVVIALAMIIGSLSSGAHMFSVRTLAAEQDSVIVPCGTDVTSSAFDEYFGAATAAEGVQTLLDKGRITVNGTVIEEKDIYINGAKALWKNEDGYWGWKTHIMRSNERDKEYTLSYNEAAIRFVKGLSLTRGPQFTITLEDGIAKKIDFEIHDACMAETVTRGETTTTVTVCDMDGEYGDGLGWVLHEACPLQF